ncbi:MAG: glycosyltransferase family 2 protein [Flavobacteriales bacterium]|nr:glycosyltransferase family 2 protein [Flavobacteriales bacterium]
MTIPTIFLLSWNRPIYLWVCLDSIYRHTERPFNLIIADNNSEDASVRDIIIGFQKREGFINEVHFCDENSPFRLKWLIEKYWDEIDDFFVIIEGDIEILPSDSCWLSSFASYFDSDPDLGMVGSKVYQKDFVSLKRAKELLPGKSHEDVCKLIKQYAKWRSHGDFSEELIDPHNPALRLMALRKNVYEKITFGRDLEMYRQIKELGYCSAISTKVVHRHLSLLNVYDQPSFSTQERDAFFNQQNK